MLIIEELNYVELHGQTGSRIKSGQGVRCRALSDLTEGPASLVGCDGLPPMMLVLYPSVVAPCYMLELKTFPCHGEWTWSSVEICFNIFSVFFFPLCPIDVHFPLQRNVLV